MAKTRAEIQKQYRERKKEKLGEKYLEEERKRVKNYYVPSNELDKKALKLRNEKKKQGMRKSRERKKKQKTGIPLIVQIGGHHGKQIGGKTRVRNTISKQRDELRKIRQQQRESEKKYKSLLRKHQRLQIATIKKANEEQTRSKASPKTPRSKANADLLREGILPKEAPSVRRKLIDSYALMEEIKESSKAIDRKSKLSIETIVGGKLLKKYRSIRRVAKETNLDRHKISKSTTKIIRERKKERAVVHRRMISRMVEDFLSRDDNSRVVPDKGEVKKTSNGQFIAKRTLTDYLGNLHQKFCLENVHIRISRATFCRLRPKYILPVSFSERSTCLCTKHQNMSLKLKALRQHCSLAHLNSTEKFFQEHTDQEIQESLNQIEKDQIKFSLWKKVDVGDGKKRMKVVDESKSKEEFIALFSEECQAFRQHIYLVKNQYAEIKSLKENLCDNEMVIQMDFSENYTCSNIHEIQGAYWNPSMVTLHPIVVYFRAMQNGKMALLHKSFVYISDELAHTCGTVFAFIKDLVPKLKEINPGITTLHYITDSPTSQYRNKSIFGIVANHEDRFGVKATWQYFEAGHGKGPCDGVGAVAKRMADEAVKQGKAAIQDALDFAAWAVTTNGAVEYVFISKNQCEEANAEIKSINVKPVKGTLKLHAVFGLGDNKVSTRIASCFCRHCYNDGNFLGQCEGWEIHSLSPEPDAVIQEQNDLDVVMDVISDEPNPECRFVELSVDKWVAALYDKKWYIGRIIEIDEEEHDINLTFLENTQVRGKDGELKFRWPKQPDELWVETTNILCEIETPKPFGVHGRCMLITQNDLDTIKQKMVNRNM